MGMEFEMDEDYSYPIPAFTPFQWDIQPLVVGLCFLILFYFEIFVSAYSSRAWVWILKWMEIAPTPYWPSVHSRGICSH